MSDPIYEATLSQTQCAIIAIDMLGHYRSYLAQPHFSTLPFDEWLQKIIEHDPNPSPNGLLLEKITEDDPNPPPETLSLETNWHKYK